MWDLLARPCAEEAARYRGLGWWRGRTFLDDLSRSATETPHQVAVLGYQDGRLTKTLSYGDLANTVRRSAAALVELGVGPGDVVVAYLPNRWMLIPLYLACLRVGAVIAPVMPLLAAREFAHILATSGATVCITVDRFGGVDYDQRLLSTAPDTVRRVVVGDATRTNAIDFDEFFVRTPHEQRQDVDPDRALGPDDPALLLFTSGTTGQMKGVVHSQNTLYAAVRTVSEPLGLGADDVICIPSYLTHMAGATYAAFMPLLLGATTVLQDDSADIPLLLDLIDRHRVTFVYATPSCVVPLVAAQRAQRRDTPALRHVVSGSAPIDPQLIDDVRDAFGVPLQALWGMTENGAVTMTRPDDPDGWAVHSDGRPMPWMQVRVAVEVGSDAGALLVRGASQCLGYFGQRELYDRCVDADGWFDTGDLARDDGRGGIRITGRRVDLITRSNGMKVSTLEVEAVLQRHPHVAEAILVGYPDPTVPGADLVCAVVIPAGDTPTLADLSGWLDREGVAPVKRPDRLQFVRVLPRNSLGKVLRQPLRQRLELAAMPRS